MKRNIFVFTILLPLVAMCQSVDIKGRVFDKNTKQPIAFCDVRSLREPEKGCISSVNGDFVLKELEKEDFVIVSILGYGSKKIAVEEFKEQEMKIELEESPFMLSQVEVTAENTQELMEEVAKSIKKSFCPRPLFDGIYRKQILEQGKYVFMGECNLKCLSQYNKKGKRALEVTLWGITVTKNQAKGESYVRQNLIDLILAYPYYPVMKSGFEWFVEKIIRQEGERIYVLGFEKKENQVVTQKGRVFYAREKKEIEKVELEIENMDKLSKVEGGAIVENGKYKAVYIYNKRDRIGRKILSYARSEWSFEVKYHNQKDKSKYRFVADFTTTKQEARGYTRKNGDFDPLEYNPNYKIVDKSLLRLIPEFE